MATRVRQMASRVRWASVIIAVAVIFLVAYYLHLGGTLRSISIGGIFSMVFGEASKPRAIASHDFFVGRWRAEIDISDLDVSTVIDWNADNTCSGTQKQIVGNEARKVSVSCRWQFSKISDDTFRIVATYSDQTVNDHVFKILSEDRILNMDQNYAVVRIK